MDDFTFTKPHLKAAALLDAVRESADAAPEFSATAFAAAVAHARRWRPDLLDGLQGDEFVDSVTAGGLYVTLSAHEPQDQDLAGFAVEMAHVVLIAIGHSGIGIDRQGALELWEYVASNLYSSIDEVGFTLICLQPGYRSPAEAE